MTKNLKLLPLFLVLIVLSCKKENISSTISETKDLQQKGAKLSLEENRSFRTSYGYIFNWDNSIDLEDELNTECGTDNIWFSLEDRFLILSDQIIAAGGAPARGGLISGTGGYGYYGEDSTGLLTFEEGANQEIDDFCECVINNSPVPLVKKELY